MSLSRTTLLLLSVVTFSFSCIATGTLRAADGATPEFVWLEGEQPSSANLDAKGTGWGNSQFLSEEKWLHCSIDAGKVDSHGTG